MTNCMNLISSYDDDDHCLNSHSLILFVSEALVINSKHYD